MIALCAIALAFAGETYLLIRESRALVKALRDLEEAERAARECYDLSRQWEDAAYAWQDAAFDALEQTQRVEALPSALPDNELFEAAA